MLLQWSFSHGVLCGTILIDVFLLGLSECMFSNSIAIELGMDPIPNKISINPAVRNVPCWLLYFGALPEILTPPKPSSRPANVCVPICHLTRKIFRGKSIDSSCFHCFISFFHPSSGSLTHQLAHPKSI